MSEPNPAAIPAAPPVPPAAGSTPAGSPPAPGGPVPAAQPTDQYVTKAELAEIKGRQDGISAALNRVEGALKKVLPADPPPGPLTVEKLKAEMDQREAKAAEREARLQDRQIRQNLEAALTAGGVDPAQAPRFATLLQLEHKPNLVVNDDSFQTGYRDGDGATARVVPLESWVKTYLQTDQGRVLLPLRQNPSFTTGAGSVPAQSLSFAQLMDPANAAAAIEMQRKYPERFQQLKADFNAQQKAKRGPAG